MSSKRSILVADDEANLCRILEAELRNAGYQVAVAYDGAQAVDKAKESDFDLIILDVRMPVMDGLSALREIRRYRKDTPIIVMTAYESHDTMASALSMGATACVIKPLDLDSLAALVKATLDEGNGQRSVDWSASIRTVFFNRNQPILLEVHDGEYAGQYHSRVEDKDDHTLTVLCPAGEAGYIMVTPGTPVSVGLAGEDAFYSFETTVLAQRENHLPLLVLSKPAVIYRVQRRKHTRVSARIPVEVAVIDDSREDQEQAGPVLRVNTENIGAGGFKIVVSEKLPKGAVVSVKATGIPGIGEFVGTGRIARVRKIAVNSHEDWEYGIQFTKVDEETRQNLARVIESRVFA